LGEATDGSVGAQRTCRDADKRRHQHRSCGNRKPAPRAFIGQTSRVPTKEIREQDGACKRNYGAGGGPQ
jgi:hypothetical protein